MERRNTLGSLALLFVFVHLGCARLTKDNEDLSGACMELGLNPHPYDCWKYLVCFEMGDGTLSAREYSCPKFEVYSHSEQSCVPQERMKPCSKGREDIKGDPECGGEEQHCKDCNSLAVCAKEPDGSYHMIGSVTCNGTHKYCDPVNKNCTNVEPIDCVPWAGCTSEGIFPNLNNCSIYYHCTPGVNNTLAFKVGVCKKGDVFIWNYSDEKNPCHHRDNPQMCITVQCNGTLEKKVYSKGSPYYVLCTPKDAFVYTCGQGVEYLPETGHCKAGTSPTPATTSSTTSATTKKGELIEFPNESP